MQTEQITKEKQSLGSILLIPFKIVKYSLIGVKAVIIDLPAAVYFVVSASVDRTYRGTKNVVGEGIEAKDKIKRKAETTYKESSFVKNRKIQLEEERQKLNALLESEEAKRVTTATLYQYIVEDKDGKIIKGYFTGFSLLDVNSYLINEGYTVYSIKTNKWLTFFKGDAGFMARKLSNKDLIFWLTQLATYVKAGIPLIDSVRLIANQLGKKSPRQKRIYESIVYELSMGEKFSDALEKQSNIFPSLLINMVRASEATGEILETLQDMADYYTETEKTRKQVISALTYPSIIMVFAFGVITFVMLYVIPQFVEVYESIDVEISGLTAGVINFSVFLQNNIVLLLLIVAIIIGVLAFMYKKIKAFKTIFQIMLMKTPVVGKIMIYKEITIFTKTFASLLKNNVDITESMDILSKITNNEIYKEIMYNTITNITNGEKISLSFKDHWAVPDIAYYMIITGESTGELSPMMEKVSEYFQETNRNLINSLKSFIEPIMITALALIVGIVIMAVIIPMFGIYEQIQM